MLSGIILDQFDTIALAHTLLLKRGHSSQFLMAVLSSPETTVWMTRWFPLTIQYPGEISKKQRVQAHYSSCTTHWFLKVGMLQEHPTIMSGILGYICKHNAPESKMIKKDPYVSIEKLKRSTSMQKLEKEKEKEKGPWTFLRACL